MMLDLDMFIQRLTETIAWCTPRAALDDVVYSLRTPPLCPAGFEFTHNANYGDYYRSFEPSLFHAEPSRLQAIVGTLAAKRAELLRLDRELDNRSVAGLTSGRLLACQLYKTLSDGASGAESKGFVDTDEVPPWDTWLSFGALGTEGWERDASPEGDYHLISWVPSSFVELVEEGIQVNPVDILAWVGNLGSAVTTQLRDAKLLQ